jgi:hypothetical protein
MRSLHLERIVPFEAVKVLNTDDRSSLVASVHRECEARHVG